MSKRQSEGAFREGDQVIWPDRSWWWRLAGSVPLGAMDALLDFGGDVGFGFFLLARTSNYRNTG